ncbi:MAG: glucuronate isomerase, partial [Synergistaceae bacterium]|nr:glucuronate isomerase [Synergistaceae bacterium]
RSNVSIDCTTEDPADDLKDHIALSKENWGCSVNPTWLPDRAFAANDAAAFNSWIDRLEAASGKSVSSYGDFLNALQRRHDFFHECGCRLSDYGIERPYAAHYASLEVERAFRKIRAGASLSGDVLAHYRASILHDLLCMDARANWTQQLHLGANRNNGSKTFRLRGSGTGYDSIGQFETGTGLVALFARLESEGCLARTIIYTLNPNDYDMIASIIGSFMDGRTPGKMQMGAAWWHNNHKDGINRQFNALAGIGLISRFVGTLTGSRSFLSYPRHEYFRRLLCAKFGTEMENGELPPDFGHIGGIVRDICFNNAVKYFGMGTFMPNTAKRGE